jgi:hypothetical protein
MSFVFLNLNPEGLIENDCVARAISLASEKDYKEIQDKLFYTSKLLECESLNIHCYGFLIEHVLGFKRFLIDNNITINRFRHIHDKGTYLIRIKGHLTVIIDGILYDIWNCDDKQVDVVWVK